MAKTDFKAKVPQWVKEEKAALDALVKQSVLEVINTAQTSTGKGGRMRVDTGFLRASGQISFTGMPSGPTRPENKKPNSHPIPNYATQIAGMQSDNPMFFGWTAAYAAARESKDGFLEAALQKWSQIVEKNAARLKR